MRSAIHPLRKCRAILSGPTPLFACAFLILAMGAPASAGDVIGDDFNEEDNQEYASLPKLRLSVEAGYSQWLYEPDSIPSSYGDYLKKLDRAQSVVAELAYFFWPRGGIGIDWVWFISHADGSGIETRAGEGPSHALSERVSVNYIGPDFLTRLHLSQNCMLVGGFGAGYLEYQETGADNTQRFKVEAHNFALLAHVGAEYPLLRFIAVGIEGRFLFSNLREYTYNGVKYRLNDPENRYSYFNIPLYRLELSGALHFML